jgi:TetR/AcrR family transcriptional regulator, fatty acid metabolism regulator protein
VHWVTLIKASTRFGRQSGSTFTGRARRVQLIGCAVDALVEVGYAGCSVAEIAHRAGVSKGVVSYHFPSKEELLTAVVADLYEQAATHLGARIEASTGAWEVLRGYLEANLEFIATHPRLIRATAEVVINLRRPDGSLHFTPGMPDPVAQHLQELLQRGQGEGQFRGFDPQSMAMIIRSAIDVASVRLVADPEFNVSAYQAELITAIEMATRNRE